MVTSQQSNKILIAKLSFMQQGPKLYLSSIFIRESLGCSKKFYATTVEPRYKEVGYNKPSYNKVILLVPALYISLYCDPEADIMRNLI